MVRVPGDKSPSIKNRSSKHRLLVRDFRVIDKVRTKKDAKNMPAQPK